MRDYTQEDVFPLTQEFLAIMLGSHRPTVTVAMRALVAAELVKHNGGRITIADPKGLAEAACECYANVYDAAKQA